MDNIVTDHEVFLIEVLTTFQHLRSMLHWEVQGHQVVFSVNPGSGVNNVPITPATIGDMKDCLDLVTCVDPDVNRAWAVLLFAARYHGKHLNFAPEQLQPLFDQVPEAWTSRP